MTMIPPSICPYKELTVIPCWCCEWHIHDTDECTILSASIGTSATSATSQSFTDRIREYENERKKLLELSKEELVDLIIHRPML